MQFKREQKTKVKVDLYGTEYEMRMPSVLEREELIKQIDDATKASQLYSLQKDFVCSLGLPLEVINEMEDDHFNELAKVFLTPKKT